MVEKIDLIVVFEDSQIANKKGEFLQLLKRIGDDKVLIDNPMYGEVRIRIANYSEPLYIPFSLYAWSLNYLKISGLNFSTDVMDWESNKDMNLFYNIFLTACKELKPAFGSAGDTTWNLSKPSRPCWDQAEYYGDPYLFCVEPPLFDGGFDPKKFCHEFLYNKDVISKLNEIKKVMSREELIKIIKKYSKKIIESDDGGVGILKIKIQGVYPRYFIRRELRKMGIYLEEGLAEKDAKLYEVKE